MLSFHEKYELILIWWQQRISKKLGKGATKVSGVKKETAEETLCYN